jgi:urease accessory protein
VGYSVGFVLSTGLLHLVGIGIGLVHARPGGVALTRLLGGGVAACGCLFLYQALAR